MDTPKTIKRLHPQKYYFRLICSAIYHLGMGDCWYEKQGRSQYQVAFYKAWSVVCNTYIVVVIMNELLAYTRNDLNDKDRNDLILFTIAHPTIYSKILSLFYFRSRITVVLQRLLEGTRPLFFSLELDKKCVKKFLWYSLVVCVTSYVTLFSATIDGVLAHLKDHTPIHIEITYYPTSSTQRGILIRVCQFFIELHWWYLVAIMVAIDCLTLASLVSVGFKFKLLQLYFENLEEDFSENRDGKTQHALEEDFRKNFIVGIQMHEDALWCARNVQSALGALYSVQVVECVSLLVMNLVKLVAAERNMIYLLATSAFIFCLIILTGAYMMAAGDITHEAALVSTSIFHCGWERLRRSRAVRALAVVALQRSQRPVHMTAFGILTLSYSNFISVLRSSYSFFAVMY